MLKRIAVLVSGGGTNLQALIDAGRSGKLTSGVVALVVSNNPEAYALERARLHGIPAVAVPWTMRVERDAFEKELSKLLDAYRIDVIVLAGFLHILSAPFVSRWEGRMINIHPSLIPAYCGKGFYGIKVHEAVLLAGEKETGATVHMVNAVPDGGRILMQKRVQVMPGDTPESLQLRVMREAEHVILPEITERLCAGFYDHDAAVLDTAKEDAKMPSYPSVESLLAGNSYPGRGIFLGLTPDGRNAVAAYFIMGRSANSRNRVFFKEKDELKIRIDDPQKLVDASLILYTPLRVLGSDLIITNGDQTDTIFEGLCQGLGFEASLESRRFEPDAPNFTPRISGILHLSGKPHYKLSILKAGDPDGTTCTRACFAYEPLAGAGHLIHTYASDGAPLPSFSGEPRAALTGDDIDAFASSVWEGLDAANRVALYVRYTDVSTGEYSDRLFNAIS